MNRPDLNIIVCVDPRKCLWTESYGRSGEDLLAELRHTVHQEGLAEAVQRTKFQTHRMARRQGSWFKSGDQRITWLDAGHPDLPDLDAQVAGHMERFLAGLPAVVK